MDSMKLEGTWMRLNTTGGMKPANETATSGQPAALQGPGSQEHGALRWSLQPIDTREQYPLFPELVIRS